MLKSNKEQGFTIIEVVLVLAIAGLIFLTVFLALPALQRSQRDNARRQDVGKVVSAMQSYLADNNGFPSTEAAISGYYGGTASLGQAASGVSFGTAAATSANSSNQRVDIRTGYDCAGGTGARKAAISILLESSNTVYCKSV